MLCNICPSPELSQPDIIFKPSLDTNIVGNFYDIAAGLVEDIFSMASLVARVSSHSDRDYTATVRGHSELKQLHSLYLDRIKQVIAAAEIKKVMS